MSVIKLMQIDKYLLLCWALNLDSIVKWQSHVEYCGHKQVLFTL